MSAIVPPWAPAMKSVSTAAKAVFASGSSIAASLSRYSATTFFYGRPLRQSDSSDISSRSSDASIRSSASRTPFLHAFRAGMRRA